MNGTPLLRADQFVPSEPGSVWWWLSAGGDLDDAIAAAERRLEGSPRPNFSHAMFYAELVAHCDPEGVPPRLSGVVTSSNWYAMSGIAESAISSGIWTRNHSQWANLVNPMLRGGPDRAGDNDHDEQMVEGLNRTLAVAALSGRLRVDPGAERPVLLWGPWAASLPLQDLILNDFGASLLAAGVGPFKLVDVAACVDRDGRLVSGFRAAAAQLPAGSDAWCALIVAATEWDQLVAELCDGEHADALARFVFSGRLHPVTVNRAVGALLGSARGSNALRSVEVSELAKRAVSAVEAAQFRWHLIQLAGEAAGRIAAELAATFHGTVEELVMVACSIDDAAA